MDEKILYLDIETWTPTGKPNPEVDQLRFIGLRFPNGDISIYTQHQLDIVQNIISHYNYIAGHNILGYDIPILERYGLKFFTKNGKRIIFLDTYQIIEKRAQTMMGIKFHSGQKSLDYLTKFFNLVDEDTQKGKFDYSKLKSTVLGIEDRKELVDYLKRDLIAGWKLLEYLYDMFYGFKQFMSPKDQQNMAWLIEPSGKTAYLILCYQAGLPPIIDYNQKIANKSYQGGFVSLPKKSFVKGNIYCLDFASLYPHMFIGGNLYSPDPNGWKGENGIYGKGEDKIIGSYSREQGKLEKVLHSLYKTRKQYKKEIKKYKPDSPEYKRLKQLILAIKIVINSAYGITGAPIYKSVYNITTARDCTAMARTSIKHARKVLSEYGYDCLYTDTDSVYVLDVFNDEKKLKKVVKEIEQEQKKSFNIPVDTHEFEIESKIKAMWFFKNDAGQFNKKHYAYLTEDDKLVIKGLQVIKSNCSKLSQLVFEKYIKPEFYKMNGEIQIRLEQLLNWLKTEAENNPRLLERRYKVYRPTAYKVTTSLQFQIAMRYGAGEHFLIPNTAIGVGKAKKYATLNELQTLGNGYMRYVIFDSYVKELREFLIFSDRLKVR